MKNESNRFLIYHSEDGRTKIDVMLEAETLWLITMTMKDWITKLEGFLTLNDREILRDAGKVSAQIAKTHAEHEFAKFRVVDDRKYESDFDRMVKLVPGKKDN